MLENLSAFWTSISNSKSTSILPSAYHFILFEIAFKTCQKKKKQCFDKDILNIYPSNQIINFNC